MSVLRNVIFDPGTPAYITELSGLLTDFGIKKAIKRANAARASNDKIVYICLGTLGVALHIEVPTSLASSANIVLIEGAFTSASVEILQETSGWKVDE